VKPLVLRVLIYLQPPPSIDGSEGAPDQGDLASTGIGALISDLRTFDGVVGRVLIEDRDLVDPEVDVQAPEVGAPDEAMAFG